WGPAKGAGGDTVLVTGGVTQSSQGILAPSPLPGVRRGCTEGRSGSRPRRAYPVLVGRLEPGVPPLSRYRVGPPGHRRRATVREALPRGVPGRLELAHHPAEARELPPRLPRLQLPPGGSIREA